MWAKSSSDMREHCALTRAEVRLKGRFDKIAVLAERGELFRRHRLDKLASRDSIQLPEPRVESGAQLLVLTRFLLRVLSLVLLAQRRAGVPSNLPGRTRRV